MERQVDKSEIPGERLRRAGMLAKSTCSQDRAHAFIRQRFLGAVVTVRWLRPVTYLAGAFLNRLCLGSWLYLCSWCSRALLYLPDKLWRRWEKIPYIPTRVDEERKALYRWPKQPVAIRYWYLHGIAVICLCYGWPAWLWWCEGLTSEVFMTFIKLSMTMDLLLECALYAHFVDSDRTVDARRHRKSEDSRDRRGRLGNPKRRREQRG